MSAPDAKRRAIALSYDRAAGTGAPKVVATGQGFIADTIVERGQDAGVAVRHDPALVEALAKLKVEAEIPEELYAAVAETLVWAYRLSGVRGL